MNELRLGRQIEEKREDLRISRTQAKPTRRHVSAVSVPPCQNGRGRHENSRKLSGSPSLAHEAADEGPGLKVGGKA